jgi:hypothetical protein
MAERAAHWVDHLLSPVAVRQWVLTVPWARRWQLARHPDLIRGVAAILLDEVADWYRQQTGQPSGETGSVTVIQRFGSALNLNVHLHCLVLDGVYAPDPTTGALVFHRVRAPSTRDVEGLVLRTADRCERWLAQRGFGTKPVDDDASADADDAQQVLQAASVQGRIAATGRRVRRVQKLGGRTFALPPRCASVDGYNLHGGVGVRPDDRPALERLCRYLLRPPLARARLREQPDGTLILGMKRAWSDGTTAIRLTPMELVEKLAALVPPPRCNTILYHGVLAARSRWRSRILPTPPEHAQDQPDQVATRLVPPDRANTSSRWAPWATLLWRVFGTQGWLCPTCGTQMTLRAVVVRPPATIRVLRGLHRAARAPPGVALAG